MKKLLIGFFLSLILASAVFADGAKMPRLSAVTPDSAKTDAEFTTTGENLGKAMVKDLYLTDGKDDIKVQIVVHKEDSIQFKAPADTKPGEYRLMLLIADGTKFLEQPVKVTIE